MAEHTETKISFKGSTHSSSRQKSDTVRFDPESDSIQIDSETVVLLAEKDDSSNNSEKTPLLSAAEKKKLKEQTVFFDQDPEKRIDFILAYRLQLDKKILDTKDKQDAREAKRDEFIKNCKEICLELEWQDCAESPDRVTYFWKVHATHISLLKGAEELLLKMPIDTPKKKKEKKTIRQRLFKFKDPFEPTIPDHLVRKHYFSAPFKLDRKEKFLGWDDEKNFFTNAQRSAIVWHILQNVRWGEPEDEIGIQRLLHDKTFYCAYPLHESTYKFNAEEDDITTMTDRQFLKSQWSSGRAWYKRQPLNQIRRYFGEKVGIYFAWLGFYTTWLLPASLVGIVVMLYGLSTVNSIASRNAIANATCDSRNQYDFYMCPRCDGRCDFWFFTDSCIFSYISQLFDNEATVFFAIFMAFWSVLFLEFWKRKQYYLQYDWDMLGYEDTQERARPQFEQKIKKYISHCRTDKEKKKFYIWNAVLEKREYIQPQWWLWPKLLATFSILISMLAVVIGIVVAVLVYRLVTAAAIYSVVANIQYGPSVGDMIVSISGACFQLVAIEVMNKLYEWLAYKLTSWELHRTQTEFEDNYITKMYLFQFVNYYTSLAYVAFFKGNVAGHPGGYNRLGDIRLDECATYGCLLELTIQLGIIFLGKQILNASKELAIPYVKRLINLAKHKEETDDDTYTRWEKDFDLVSLSEQGLFSEYLELVIQYGFVTLFVAAFPLAPLFALIRNYFEIRIDAHKFVVVFRRPVAERAQDIGAWFGTLTIVSQLSVITNAFVIVFTGQFIPQLVFRYTTPEPVRLSEYVNWSLSEFSVDTLINGQTFPSYSALSLDLKDMNGNDIKNKTSGEPYLYLPFVKPDCIREMDSTVDIANTTRPDGTIAYGFVNDNAFLNVYLRHVFNYNFTGDSKCNLATGVEGCTEESPHEGSQGMCYQNTTCRFRGFTPAQDSTQSLKYWELQTARLAFILVFTNLISVIVGFLAFIVPDVPRSVKNEIQKEKLLSFEALHAEQIKSGIVEQTAAELEVKRQEDQISGEHKF